MIEQKFECRECFGEPKVGDEINGLTPITRPCPSCGAEIVEKLVPVQPVQFLLPLGHDDWDPQH